MKDLIALVEVVSKNKIKQIDIMGSPNGNDTQLQKLYEGIHTGNLKTETDVMKVLFSETKNAALNTTRLKAQLRERLINSLFFIDLTNPNFNDYQRAYYNCYKMATAVRILLARNARHAATSIAEKALDIALQFDLTDVAFSLLRDLRTHYGARKGFKDKYEEINRTLEEQTEILLAEIKAERYVTDLAIDFARTKGAKPELVTKARQYNEELEQLSLTIKSFRFNYMAFLARATMYEIANDYKNLVVACQNALSFFEQKQNIVSITALFSFTLRQLIGYIQLKNYDAAREVAIKCLSFAPEGTNNWFLALNYHILLAFHTGNFQEAYQISQKALHHPKLKKQIEQIVEYWKILEAYIYYLISIKKIVPDENNPMKKFRINKFVNEVVIYKKDKSGANISVLILQILFLLNEQKYNGIIDRTESLKSYQQRYLRNDETFRSQCFIRMLILMSECSFNKKATIRKTERLLQKLESKPINLAEQSADIEPIPYEVLWDFVLNALDDKWH